VTGEALDEWDRLGNETVINFGMASEVKARQMAQQSTVMNSFLTQSGGDGLTQPGDDDEEPWTARTKKKAFDEQNFQELYQQARTIVQEGLQDRPLLMQRLAMVTNAVDAWKVLQEFANGTPASEEGFTPQRKLDEQVIEALKQAKPLWEQMQQALEFPRNPAAIESLAQQVATALRGWSSSHLQVFGQTVLEEFGQLPSEFQQQLRDDRDFSAFMRALGQMPTRQDIQAMERVMGALAGVQFEKVLETLLAVHRTSPPTIQPSADLAAGSVRSRLEALYDRVSELAHELPTVQAAFESAGQFDGSWASELSSEEQRRAVAEALARSPRQRRVR